LLAAGVGVAVAPLGNLHALAATHLVTLGWVTVTIMGASYQLVPVVLATRLWSERLGHAALAGLLPGVAAMVAGFWAGRLGLVIGGGALVAAAFLLYAYNLARSLAAATRRGTPAPFLVAALACLVAAGGYGLTLAVNLVRPLLPAGPVDPVVGHVLLGLLGWITLLAMGAGYQLVPMFALAYARGAGWSAWVLGLVGGGGLLLIAVLALAPRPAVVAGVALVPLAGVYLFLADQWLTLRGRQRRRLDLGLRFTVVAFVYLGLAATSAWGAASGLLPVRPAVPVLLGLFGWAGCLIVGQLYKIVPFLVWYRRYAARAGLEPVPLLAEMYSPVLGAWNLGAYAPAPALLAGGAALGSGPLFAAGALLALTGAALLLANLRRVLVR
jgi:hypothetical protein